MTRKARIAHLAGPNATIQNTPPLVTSNKARVKHQLPPLTNPDGSPARFDVLRATPGRAGHRLCRAIQRTPARSRRGRALWAAGRLHRQRRASTQGAAERRRQAGV